MGNSNSSPESTDNSNNSAGDKKSLYRRYEDKKRGSGVSDEDILKYTGRTREQLNDWAETQPGVGKNQPAGKLTIGPASGFAGSAAAGGLGGWGTEGTRKMKFPAKKEPTKTIDDSDEED
ncbi:hypothetical protein TARUN_121 [Trichoderma arundinaceum]|uniref:Uncharacterized protein n=1 Tax=Trichoderma arundinaceum TaxID=490622 RepID=A0A395P427_TRIAR|nr:hypothetical protein TARUN_121 [Trichoderma arundinaceum]